MAETRSLVPDEREFYEKQIFDLRQLLEISKSLNSTLDYNILIDSILYTIMGQMRVLKAGLFAKKGIDTPFFSLHRNYKGFELDRRVDYSIPEDHPVVTLFQRQYGCCSMSDLTGKLGRVLGLPALTSLEPSLIVPLKTKGTITGLIVLGERIDGEEYFEPEEREYLVNIAAFAAIAINNAFLFEMTTTDHMTRLKLKHYFYTVLMERMDDARTGEKALAVAMIDIDFFKKFNDTYGHLCGDAVLKQVARIIQGMVRNEDVAARYGGEEFCVLLTDADEAKARLVSERIRAAVESSCTEYDNKALCVTVSVGFACFDPERDRHPKNLIERADRALYYSKQNGRNRVSKAD